MNFRCKNNNREFASRTQDCLQSPNIQEEIVLVLVMATVIIKMSINRTCVECKRLIITEYYRKNNLLLHIIFFENKDKDSHTREETENSQIYGEFFLLNITFSINKEHLKSRLISRMYLTGLGVVLKSSMANKTQIN